MTGADLDRWRDRLAGADGAPAAGRLDFGAAVAARCEAGAREYGDRSFGRKPADLAGEMGEELADAPEDWTGEPATAPRDCGEAAGRWIARILAGPPDTKAPGRFPEAPADREGSGDTGTVARRSLHGQPPVDPGGNRGEHPRL